MSLGGMLDATVTFSPPASVSAAGDPTFGAQTTARARVEYGTKFIYGRDNTELQCEAVIASDVEIPMGSRIWLPGTNPSDNNAAKRPLTVKRASSPGGTLTVYETYL